MHRILIVGAIALAILLQSDCLSIRNGKLINKCGIWQYFTNSSIVLLVEDKSEKKSASISENEIRGYGRTLPISASTISSGTNIIGKVNIDQNTSGTVITTPKIISTPRTSTITAMVYTDTSMISSSGMYMYNNSPTIIYCGNNNTYNNNSACYQGR